MIIVFLLPVFRFYSPYSPPTCVLLQALGLIMANPPFSAFPVSFSFTTVCDLHLLDRSCRHHYSSFFPLSSVLCSHKGPQPLDVLLAACVAYRLRRSLRVRSQQFSKARRLFLPGFNSLFTSCGPSFAHSFDPFVMGDSLPVFSPSPASPTQALCNVLFEEFKIEFELPITASCPVCSHVGARHTRRPTVPSVVPLSTRLAGSVVNHSSPRLAAIDATPSIESLAVADPIDVPDAVLTRFERLDRSSRIPRWTSQSVCRTFLQRLQLSLSTSGIPQQYWSFVFSFVADDVSVATWLNDRIVQKQLDWPTACSTFTAHFEASDYSAVLLQRYYDLHQARTESVQEYADRFTTLCSALGVAQDDFMTINQFLRNLSDRIQRQYYDFLALEKARGTPYKPASLAHLIEICIGFDVAKRNVAVHSSRPPPPPGALIEQSDPKPAVWCSYHNSTTHSTAACSVAQKALPAIASSGSDPSSSRAPADRKATVTCYSCNELGHYAPDCPKKQQPAVSTSAVASTSPTSPPNVSTFPRRSPRLVTPGTQPIVSALTTDSNAAASVIILSVRGSAYGALLDTGATLSIIDRALATELALSVVPATGQIHLASANQSTERIGVTAPLAVTAMFPDVLPRMANISVEHAFEVMSLDSRQYRFIIGKDLLHLLFPVSIPSSFYVSAPTSAAPPRLVHLAVRSGPPARSTDFVPPGGDAAASTDDDDDDDFFVDEAELIAARSSHPAFARAPMSSSSDRLAQLAYLRSLTRLPPADADGVITLPTAATSEDAVPRLVAPAAAASS